MHACEWCLWSLLCSCLHITCLCDLEVVIFVRQFCSTRLQANPKSRRVYSTCPIKLMVVEDCEILSCPPMGVPPRLKGSLIAKADYNTLAKTLRGEPLQTSGTALAIIRAIKDGTMPLNPRLDFQQLHMNWLRVHMVHRYCNAIPPLHLA